MVVALGIKGDGGSFEDSPVLAVVPDIVSSSNNLFDDAFSGTIIPDSKPPHRR